MVACVKLSNASLILVSLLIIYLLTTTYAIEIVNTAVPITYEYEDDFDYSSDTQASKYWIIFRGNNDPSQEVVWDPGNSRVMLTTTYFNAGGIYFKKLYLPRYSSWMIEYIGYIGGGNQADGMAFAFYHAPVFPNHPFGKYIGVSDTPGYFIKIDTYKIMESLFLHL